MLKKNSQKYILENVDLTQVPQIYPFLQIDIEWFEFQSSKTSSENKHVLLLCPDEAHCEGQSKS